MTGTDADASAIEAKAEATISEVPQNSTEQKPVPDDGRTAEDELTKADIIETSDPSTKIELEQVADKDNEPGPSTSGLLATLDESEEKKTSTGEHVAVEAAEPSTDVASEQIQESRADPQTLEISTPGNIETAAKTPISPEVATAIDETTVASSGPSEFSSGSVPEPISAGPEVDLATQSLQGPEPVPKVAKEDDESVHKVLPETSMEPAVQSLVDQNKPLPNVAEQATEGQDKEMLQFDHQLETGSEAHMPHDQTTRVKAIGVQLTQEAIRAKAMTNLKSFRRVPKVVAPPELRGFKGKTFVTAKGRKLTAEEFCKTMDNLTKRKGHVDTELNPDGSVRVLQPVKDPFAKTLSPDMLLEMRDRLCTPRMNPGRPVPKKSQWLKQTLVDSKWTDTLSPWKEIPLAAKTESMRSMYDRHKEDRLKKHTQLAGAYLQPLVKLKGCPATPEKDLDAYMYRLMRFYLPPKFHKAAKEVVKVHGPGS